MLCRRHSLSARCADLLTSCATSAPRQPQTAKHQEGTQTVSGATPPCLPQPLTPQQPTAQQWPLLSQAGLAARCPQKLHLRGCWGNLATRPSPRALPRRAMLPSTTAGISLTLLLLVRPLQTQKWCLQRQLWLALMQLRPPMACSRGQKGR